MCWEWTDVLYFVTNQRKDRHELDQALSDKILKWNAIDAKIYEKANITFWEKYNKIDGIETMRNEFQLQLGKEFESPQFNFSSSCTHLKNNSENSFSVKCTPHCLISVLIL